jgi:hypothetical protein
LDDCPGAQHVAHFRLSEQVDVGGKTVADVGFNRIREKIARFAALKLKIIIQ